MAATPREIGTLIVVILKARNLPNKRHIGKQDPYCTIVLNGEKRRTKAIRRGGQHPEWDEEIRFTVFEDPDDEAERLANRDSTPPPPPPKSKGPPKIKGGKFMVISCFAEDPREPDLIGDTHVDLTEVLTKGETDEWFTLTSKDKYCGEVYLELTFWSNEPAPMKKKPKTQRQYGGPGSFVPIGEPSSTSGLDVQHSITRLPSSSSVDLRRDNIPASLRASNSTAHLDLYVPPYETSRSHNSVDGIASEFGNMAVTQRRSRRQSLPPQSGYLRRPSSTIGFPDPQGGLSIPGYRQSTYSDSGSSYGYDRPVTPGASAPTPYNQTSLSQSQYEPYQPQYESALVPSSGYAAATRQNGPRYSMPPTSSGFMPVPAPAPAPSGFVPLASIPQQPTGFTPLSAATPAPIGYGPPPSHNQQQSQLPSSSFSAYPPASVQPGSYMHHQHSGSYHHPPPLQQQQPSGYSYQQYVTSPTSSVPPQLQQQLPPPPPTSTAPPSQMVPQQSYMTSAPQQPYVPPQPHTPPQQYPSHQSTPPPSHDHIPPPPPLNDSPTGGYTGGSRPLPQPSQAYQQHARRQSALPMPPSSSFSAPGSSIGYPSSMPYNPIPPPPPLPSTTPAPYNQNVQTPASYSQNAQRPLTYSPTGQQSGSYSPTSGPYSASNPPPTSYPQSGTPPTQYPSQPTPGPPPPLPQSQSQTYQHAVMRRPSLPAPPSMSSFANQSVAYPGQSAYQALPPPTPHQSQPQSYPSASQSQTFYPGPPPRPPGQPQYAPQQAGYPPAVAEGSW